MRVVATITEKSAKIAIAKLLLDTTAEGLGPIVKQPASSTSPSNKWKRDK